MKCIMVRLDGYAFADVSHDSYVHAAAAFSRTTIIDMLGKMLCEQIGPDDSLLDKFNQFIMVAIDRVVDERNSGKDEFDHDEYFTSTEKDRILEYFVHCYKLNRPYVPKDGTLKFMACVWHEDMEFAKASVCLVAEHRTDGESISEIESGDNFREPREGDGAGRRYLSAVFK